MRPHILAVIATASLQFGPSAAWSQSRDSAREATYERYWEFRSLIKGAMVQPAWIADGTGFWYATGAPDNTVIYRVDLQADTKVPLFDVARVRAALTPLLGHEPAYRGLPFDEFTFEEGGKAAKFTVEGRPFVLNLATYQVDALPAPTAAERDRTMPRRVSPEGGGLPVMEVPSPDGRWFVTHKDHNLWLRSGRDGRLLQLTWDGVARDEWIVGGWWGIRPSTAKWSPDGLRLAAMKIDTRRVRVQPLVHWLNPEEEVQWEVNPISGGAIQQMAGAVCGGHHLQGGSSRRHRARAGPVSQLDRMAAGWERAALFPREPGFQACGSDGGRAHHRTVAGDADGNLQEG